MSNLYRIIEKYWFDGPNYKIRHSQERTNLRRILSRNYKEKTDLSVLPNQLDLIGAAQSTSHTFEITMKTKSTPRSRQTPTTW
jgi:hypothetical protein